MICRNTVVFLVMYVRPSTLRSDFLDESDLSIFESYEFVGVDGNDFLDVFFDVAVEGGVVYMVGATKSIHPNNTLAGGMDAFMVKVSSGKATSTVSDGGEGIPTEFELQGNYLNPFNPETVIPFGLPQSSHVVLEVYNLLGKRVAVLLDEPMAAGRHAVTWYAVDEPSGVYLVRLVAGKVQKTQHVTLVK